jgi:AcrR family transcriptional regulator
VSTAEQSLTQAPALRADPMQARSTKRLEGLLDAAASYIHSNGYETLTTNHVASISGSSIGTVYRYFPDRIALLDALIVRNLERTQIAAHEALSTSAPGSLDAAVEDVVDVLVTMFSSEPGFRSIRLGDSLDIRPVRPERWGNRSLAESVAMSLQTLWGAKKPEHQTPLEHAIETADAFLAKAFLMNEAGDKKSIAVAKRLALAASTVG